mmetsp:Transcript_127056/g.247597  ORF Transcript_127056/g.247597 Transcript_127056/m.247597 type:complete len:308 (-) Transcript_127056:128-1051(-)|eukprot:CAMPEP_0172708280 /NCGR_PEP_ID=MMETSP1074-20121228/50464_1 /TAXON_ID=2916 /ORGANISM="Ceratium fusus, Strain PA161109" /LENGTH=307 /DNA_ID=CAMNT_0013531197 /DNA_START=45 /DNA_END=968 /DNA_ORIENTATION=-
MQHRWGRATVLSVLLNVIVVTSETTHFRTTETRLHVDNNGVFEEPHVEKKHRTLGWMRFMLLKTSSRIHEKLHEYIHPLSGAAVVTTVALQLSPLPSTLEIRRDKNVKRYDGYPYFAVLAGASQWCLYGAFAAMKLKDANFLTMVAANGPGVMMGSFYISSYFRFVPKDDARSVALKWYLAVGCTLFFSELIACHVLGKTAVFWLGLLGAVGSAQIALSPFGTLPEVLSTRSTRSWPLDLCFWNFIQSMATGCFGLANSDPWVWVPNAIGVIAAVIQLSLIAAFRSPAASGPDIISIKAKIIKSSLT